MKYCSTKNKKGYNHSHNKSPKSHEIFILPNILRTLFLNCIKEPGAIQAPMGTKIKEVDHFEPNDPTKVVGAYSQSKAKASQMVLDAVRVMGLKACIVHPSDILGPNDHAIGETTHTLLQIIKGEMPVGMHGSFNLCDVRDLAYGCIAAVDKGRIGESYILANEPVTLKEMC